MATIEHIGSYKVKSGDQFFFDCNVWMFIFSPFSVAKKHQQKIYTNLLRDIQTARASIVTSSLILSEYINRSLRLNYENWKDTEVRNGNRFVKYKEDYRKTSDFKEDQMSINEEVKDILKIAQRMPDNFHTINLEAIFKETDMDFNDAYYTSLCKLDNYILVSDDKDLQNTQSDIKILTM